MSEVTYHGMGELLFFKIDEARVVRQAVEAEDHMVVAWLNVEENGYSGINDIKVVEELEAKFQEWVDAQPNDEEVKSMAEHFADYEDEISRKFAAYTTAQKREGGDLPN